MASMEPTGSGVRRSWMPWFRSLDWGKICRKPWFLPLNMEVSCKFSLKPIHWLVWQFSLKYRPPECIEPAPNKQVETALKLKTCSKGLLKVHERFKHLEGQGCSPDFLPYKKWGFSSQPSYISQPSFGRHRCRRHLSLTSSTSSTSSTAIQLPKVKTQILSRRRDFELGDSDIDWSHDDKRMMIKMSKDG